MLHQLHSSLSQCSSHSLRSKRRFPQKWWRSSWAAKATPDTVMINYRYACKALTPYLLTVEIVDQAQRARVVALAAQHINPGNVGGCADYHASREKSRRREQELLEINRQQVHKYETLQEKYMSLADKLLTNLSQK